VTTPGVFQRVTEALRDAGIKHMLTGSFASAFHGSPRSTQDIDLVIEADIEKIEALVRLLPPDEWYVDRDAALDALRHETQFNAIDLAAGWKVDFMIRKSRPFSLEEFQRRQPAILDGTPIDVVSAEDLIVAKLEWAKAGGSHRQLEDVASILRIRGKEVDETRVTQWVETLGLEREWQSARALLGRATNGP
jgi:hypothetical protein